MSETVILLADIYFNNGFEVRRVSTHSYHTPFNDPDTDFHQYLPKIAEGSEPTYSTEVGLFIWENQSSLSFGNIELINNDGEFDDWLSLNFRDAIVELRLAKVGQAWTNIPIVGVALVDNLIMEGDNLVIFLKGLDTLLERQVEQSTFADKGNEIVNGQTHPFGIGKLFQAQPVLVNAANLDYELCYSPNIDSISAVWVGGSEADSPEVSPPQWEYNDDMTGFRMLVNPQAKIVVDFETKNPIKTLVWTAEEHGNFRTFVVEEPEWDIIEGMSGIGAAPLPQYSQTLGAGLTMAAYEDENGVQSAGILYLLANPVVGKSYFIFGKIAELNFGKCLIFAGGETFEINEAGNFSFFVESASSTTSFQLSTSGETLVTVASFYVYEAGVVDATWQNVQRALIAKAGLELSVIDEDSVTATSFPNIGDVGFYTNGSITVKQVLDMLSNSRIGWSAFAQNGKLVSGVLNPSPSLDDSVLEISNLNTEGLPIIELDQAPNITDGMKGRKNWTPYSETELAGIAIPDQQRFIPEYQIRKRGTSRLAQAYQHGISGEPATSLIMDETGLQNSIDLLSAIYSDYRFLITTTVIFDDPVEAALIKKGDVVNFTSSMYGNFNGSLGQVMRVDGRFRTNTLTLKIWVSEPAIRITEEDLTRITELNSVRVLE